MRGGSSRSEVNYLWPTTLRQPARPPLLVYLDLNHWVSLSKAYSGHPDGSKHDAPLRAFLSASSRGTAVFPLTDSTYIEVAKIGRYRQRRDLRNVIEEVSRYRVVTGRHVISAHEIETMLDKYVGPSSEPVNTMEYLDWGVLRAVGLDGGLQIKERSPAGDSVDVTENVRDEWPDGPAAFDQMILEAHLSLQRSVLDGPTPDEEASMRAGGWNPTAAYDVAVRRAQQEIDNVAVLDNDPTWRRGRLRDLIATRELIIELEETLREGLALRGATMANALGGPDVVRERIDNMPSFDVAVTMKAEYHRNGQHRWKPNDILDIDALGSTLPYCDIVATDRAAADHAIRSGLADRLDTKIVSNLEDVVALLG